MNLWIVGCGDIGRRVAVLYQKDNITARGLVYSKDSVQLCNKVGVAAQTYDLDIANKLDTDIFYNAHLFYFAPPPSTDTVDSRLQQFLDQVKHKPKKIVLISTTGIYGNSSGDWIDETFPAAPVADRAKRRLSAEILLQTWAAKYKKDIVILRVPGIYAADRLPLQRLRKGLPLVKKDEAPWTNRIHADDLAQACKQAMSVNAQSIIYNVTDGSPSTMTDYFNHVADYSNLPRPPQISMEEAVNTLSKGMVSYLQESRRIRNDRMLNELNIVLKYPNLETGLPLKVASSTTNS